MVLKLKLYNLSIHEIKNKLENREVKAVEIVEANLNRINSVENKVNSYITITEDIAIEKAKDIDKKINNNESIGVLGGVPMAIKDNICTEGILTSCASKMLENFIPPYNATVYEKLLSEGGIILGKTNMDEFAMGSSTETSFYKNTKNPWDINKIPGGSSGGSAAAVAAGEAAFTLGSDTGGSIRQPASFCGLVGLKTTYGLVSRYGLIAMASSLDSIGPITRNVKDAALVLNAIAGYDSSDGTSINKDKVDYLNGINDGVKGLKIAIPKEYFDEDVSDTVKKSVLKAAKVFKDLGAVCEEVSLSSTKYVMATYGIISEAEISLNFARFDGIRYGHRSSNYKDIESFVKSSRSEGFGSEVKKRIMKGTYWLSKDNYEKYYKKADYTRKLIKADFNNVFSNYDIILTPTVATTALEIGTNQESITTKKKLDGYVAAANLAGIPALSVPCDFDKGLPIGMQLIGRAFDEKTLLRAARAFEKAINLNNILST